MMLIKYNKKGGVAFPLGKIILIIVLLIVITLVMGFLNFASNFFDSSKIDAEVTEAPYSTLCTMYLNGLMKLESNVGKPSLSESCGI